MEIPRDFNIRKYERRNQTWCGRQFGTFVHSADLDCPILIERFIFLTLK